MTATVTYLSVIPVADIRQAMQVLNRARNAQLQASYHPHGGQTSRKNVPITHSVWVMGSQERIRDFKQTLKVEGKHA